VLSNIIVVGCSGGIIAAAQSTLGLQGTYQAVSEL